MTNSPGVLPRKMFSAWRMRLGRRGALMGRHIYMRGLRRRDYREWVQVRQKSREFLKPWEPFWGAENFSRSFFRARVRQHKRNAWDGLSHHFFLFSRKDDRLVGGLTVYDISRGASNSCAIGYWIGAPYRRRGFMREALCIILPFLFDELKFARITAACLPENEASQALLLGCGFKHEGRAREFMQIAGKRRDHIVFAILRDDTRPVIAGEKK